MKVIQDLRNVYHLVQEGSFFKLPERKAFITLTVGQSSVGHVHVTTSS